MPSMEPKEGKSTKTPPQILQINQNAHMNIYERAKKKRTVLNLYPVSSGRSDLPLAEVVHIALLLPHVSLWSGKAEE